MKKIRIIIVKKTEGYNYKVVEIDTYNNVDNSKFILQNTKLPLIPSLIKHFEEKGLTTLSIIKDEKTETMLLTFVQPTI